MTITVHQAILGDLEALSPLFDAYRQFYRKPADLDLARHFLKDRLQHNESVIFMALDEHGAAVGFTQLFPSFSSASAARIFVLNDLFVKPEARRSGAASQLLDAAAHFGRASGAVRLALSTEVTNVAAQALYEGAGWKRQTDFYDYTLSLG